MTTGTRRIPAPSVALLAEGVDRNLLGRLNAQRHPVALLAEGVDRNQPLRDFGKVGKVSPSSRRAWIEIMVLVLPLPMVRSPSSRRAWIEIRFRPRSACYWLVALLAEGVDRNISTQICAQVLGVALLAEGVDRNNFLLNGTLCIQMSPSSRRAWIEISSKVSGAGLRWVALLAEGVDRNRTPSFWMLSAACRPPRGGRG